MLRDDLALLKMAWLNHAMSRYDTLNDVAKDAACVLPLLQRAFTLESGRLSPEQADRSFSPLPSQQAVRDTPEQRQKQ